MEKETASPDRQPDRTPEEDGATRYADLAIALNTTLELGRDPICRLAASPDKWVETVSQPSDQKLASKLRLSKERLDLARRVAANASRIASRERRRASAIGTRLVSRWDADYPAPLLDLELPPPALYVRGRLPADALSAGLGVAIVGSRQADTYGREVARLFGRRLAARGITVVSGFARGVDAAAHRGALESRHPAATVAVIGCGIDVDYPRGHERLRQEISEQGAMVSEFPLGVRPAAWQFPVRNRLLAALGRATLVVQATVRSGSLITARLALELGRDVYAIAGRIFDEKAHGTNALIRDGAHPVLHPEEIAERLVPDSTPPARDDPPRAAGLAVAEEPVLAALPPGEALLAEELAVHTGKPVNEVAGRLLELELEGAVRREPSGRYCRVL